MYLLPATNCAIDGVGNLADLATKLGVAADTRGGLNLSFHAGGGARLFLASTEDTYKTFQLLGNEISFDVDVSNLPCGVNGALYLVEMEADGGKASYPENKAGAKYGTGYCDAQCPTDIHFIDGEANLVNPATNLSFFGSCCAEMDLWEANNMANALTPHPCHLDGPKRCEVGGDCGGLASSRSASKLGLSAEEPPTADSPCDKAGCDFNPFRVGNTTFYGPGPSFAVDTTKPMTVTTQFLTSGAAGSGDLVEIRRFYKQGGQVIGNADAGPVWDHTGPDDSITDGMCERKSKYFGDEQNGFATHGGLKQMGEAMRRGMVLTLSVWDDQTAGMTWLDSTAPYPVPAWVRGASRGACSQESGYAARKQHPNAYVLFSNIRYGEIGSTTGPSPPPPPAPPPKPSPCPGGSKAKCIATCDPANPAKYLQCVHDCGDHCPHDTV